MVKEKILNNLKALILSLKDKEKFKNEAFRKLWLKKLEDLQKNCFYLNEKDTKEIEIELAKFFSELKNKDTKND